MGEISTRIPSAREAFEWQRTRQLEYLDQRAPLAQERTKLLKLVRELESCGWFHWDYNFNPVADFALMFMSGLVEPNREKGVLSRSHNYDDHIASDHLKPLLLIFRLFRKKKVNYGRIVATLEKLSLEAKEWGGGWQDYGSLLEAAAHDIHNQDVNASKQNVNKLWEYFVYHRQQTLSGLDNLHTSFWELVRILGKTEAKELCDSICFRLQELGWTLTSTSKNWYDRVRRKKARERKSRVFLNGPTVIKVKRK